ncbi:cytochrome P450 [Artomyces pyxidatus]|uniref:Cytochrome P450 n=1 Tax=Artomyces pyxidatus TaxID=48021 RepID=A0ACB8SQ59_9AGAM|nr:cytochrome P450 [Artomyces pyxidatus]
MGVHALSTSNALLALVASLGVFVLYKFVAAHIRAYKSPLRDLPGPKRLGFAFGSFPGIPEFEGTRLQEQWTQQYGHTYKFHSFFGTQKVITTDLKALSHVLSHGNEFQKSNPVRFILGSLVGRGLLFVEGAKHRQHRRIVNPAFGPIQVRKFTELFVDKSIELRDIWLSKISQSTRKDGRVKLDVFNWLNKVTLDIIGLAGFNYDFGALYASDDEPNELSEAVREMFAFNNEALLFLLQLVIPAFRIIPTAQSRKNTRCLQVVRRVGLQMIAEKKAAVLAESSNIGKSLSIVERKDVQGHDLLSLLIKSNMAADIPETGRMNDEEILAQVPTFLVAGHETTSTGVAWTMFALAGHPDIQAKLRAEVCAFPTDRPSMDELNAMTYLDCVVREALRLHSPVGNTERVATQDTVIPVSTPFIDRNGVPRHEIRLAKGDVIFIPIREINRSEELWGEDANEFKPERWIDIPEATRSIPGVWGNMLTFLAGPHACIGYRFSIIETKALLFIIVRSFEFELGVSPEDIIRRTRIVGRPSSSSNPGAGPMLPVLLRPVKQD